MNILQSLILGIVEGLTEFLPISSTFHLIVTSKILGLAQTEYLKAFEVVIQGGAIAALLFIYLKTLLADKKLIKNVIISFLPTALVGVTLYGVIKSVFFETNWLMLTVFTLMGIVFLILERSKLKLLRICTDITTKEAVLIGIAQACSVIPGVSRAGAVIVIMMLLGYRRDEAAKYTFLLSLPTIGAASLLDLAGSYNSIATYPQGMSILITGFIVAFVAAYFVVKWFISYLSTHTLKIFGWYRLVLGALLIFFKVLT